MVFIETYNVVMIMMITELGTLHREMEIRSPDKEVQRGDQILEWI